jgi:aryl-alcohol dehydrogenase-like predicted oxidoreductase
METRRIGTLEVSVVGIGCNNFGWRLDQERTTVVVQAAIDAGATFFDTADVYGDGESETFIGNAFRSRRDEVVIATKFGGPFQGGPRTRLGVDHIDLFQLHWPDPATPIADTLGAMNELVVAGKVREIGCSNLSVEQLRAARDAVTPGAHRFVSVQNEYSLFARGPELDVIPECEAEGIAFLPYYPLFNGMLTGKYTRGGELPAGARLTNAKDNQKQSTFSDRNFTIVEELTAYAESRGHTILELAFARLLAQPSIPSVIAGATSSAQITANAAAGSWRLTDEEIKAIDAIAPVG